jgi:hypothetical protein
MSWKLCINISNFVLSHPTTAIYTAMDIFHLDSFLNVLLKTASGALLSYYMVSHA